MTRSRTAVLAAVAAFVGAPALTAPSSAAARPPAAAKATPAVLAAVRGRVERWLGSAGFGGFRVGEVMAFSNNDYVAVDDEKGNAAFELLVAPDGRSWVMEEPPSMMWNTRYGMLAHTGGTLEPIPGLSMMWGGAMMGSPSSWYSTGAGRVRTIAGALRVADGWLAAERPGEQAESDGRAFPGYFTLDTTRAGRTYGMLSVDARTGAVWYHGWHGTFLAERLFGS